MTAWPSLGKQLRERRLQLGVGLTEMARHVGVSAAYLSGIENGKKIPLRASTIDDLARYYQLDHQNLARLRRVAHFTLLLREGEAVGLTDAKQLLALDILVSWGSLTKQTLLQMDVVIRLGPTIVLFEPLASRLLRRRIELGLSQSEMAARLSLNTTSYVSLYENDRRVPLFVKQLSRFAEAYELDLSEVEALALYSRRLHETQDRELGDTRQGVALELRERWNELTQEIVAQLRLLIRENAGQQRAMPQAHKVERPTLSKTLEDAVLTWRQQDPSLGKDRIATLLREQGNQVSYATVGRILTRLKREGRLPS